MAVYSEGRYVDRIAGQDFTIASHAFRIVKQQSDSGNPTGRSLVLATGATDKLYGVLNLDANRKSGEPVSVCARNAEGTFKVAVSANSAGVAIGDELTVSSDGGAITTTTSGDQVIGIAEEAGVAGQIIEYRPVNRKYGN